VFAALKPEAMATIVTDFTPLPGSRVRELAANFDVVLGKTAIEDDDGVWRGGLGKKVYQPTQR
jgi:protocatechuate 3,4-dioxygenase, beta subunit